MAKFTLRPDNSSCFFPLKTHTTRSHSHPHSPFIKTSFQRFHFHFSSSPKLTHRIIVRSTHQNVKESETVSKIHIEKEEEEDKFSAKWPPWKNLPLRYKLIATTSLAFVICNMDKVVTFYKIALILFLYWIDLNWIGRRWTWVLQ